MAGRRRDQLCLRARCACRRLLIGVGALCCLLVAPLVAPPVMLALPYAGAAQPASASEQVTATGCQPAPGRVACFAVIRPVPTRPSTVLSSGPYSPGELHDAYQIPYSTTTATVAVVDAYGAPSVEADLAVYRSHFGLPACTLDSGCLRIIDQDGGSALPAPPQQGAAWIDETELDVEMVSAICPTCHLLLVQARSDYLQDMLAAVEQATSQGAKYVSMSWGVPEQTGGMRIAAVPGVAYVAASGDAGYGTNYPAADPAVVSVGGTSLVRSGNARGWTDTVWGDGAGGTGGGCSSQEAMPQWQQALPALLAVCANRSLNDVSIVADPNTGVYIYDQGSWQEGGGTSAGAPMIAAMYALAGQMGTSATVAAPELLYAHPGAFVDITQGSNGTCGSALCAAGPGYDTPSGLGVPRGLGGFVAGSAPPIILRAPARLVNSYVGQRVRVALAAMPSGAQPLTYFTRGLPSGLSLSATGVVHGIARSVGTSKVYVTAVDAMGSRAALSFTWKVVNPSKIVPSCTPAITGRLAPGQTVTASWGVLRARSTRGPVIHPTVRVRWYLDGRPVKHQTGRTFRIPLTAANHRLSYVVSAWGVGYTTFVHATAGRLIGSGSRGIR